MENKELAVVVRGKIAAYKGKECYVCGNSDYNIAFDLDEEWAAHDTKTARFIKDDTTYQEQIFTGNLCPVPVISDTYGMRVGIYAGDLRTTTPAYIPAKKSILCGAGLPADPAPDVYTQLMAHLQRIEENGVSDDQVERVITQYLEENPIDTGIDFTTDETLTLSAENVLSVNRATEVEADNTLPITSAAVYETVGNINALLASI